MAMENTDYLGTLLDMFELEGAEISDSPSESLPETSPSHRMTLAKHF
ncbi:hypothetical protein PMI21_01869 [Pseudomonas sp. GM18]|nr:hypothetical protein PMI21_01869 [Pseudomonas sp. GM18]